MVLPGSEITLASMGEEHSARRRARLLVAVASGRARLGHGHARVDARKGGVFAALLDETVGIARCVSALQAGLVHAQSAEVVVVGERIAGPVSCLRLRRRVDAGHPGANAVGVEDVSHDA
jgi:hypothetical protein